MWVIAQHTPCALLSVFGACSIQGAARACVRVSAGPRALSVPRGERAQATADVLGSACVCALPVSYTPFPITGLIWNSAPTSRIAWRILSSPGGQCRGLAARFLHPSAKPLSHSPSRPAVNQPAGSATLRTLRRPWQTLCPPSPSGPPITLRSPLRWMESGYSPHPCE